MKWLSAKLWEYSELPRPRAYPSKGHGRKLAKLTWDDFMRISDAHWRNLLVDLCNIGSQSLVIDFASNKVRYDVRKGFVFLGCYAEEPALDWESAKLFSGIINEFHRAAMCYEHTLDTPTGKRFFYRKVEERLLFLYNDVYLDFLPEKTSAVIKHDLMKLIGLYHKKLEKIDQANESNQAYTLSVSIGTR